MAKPKAQHSTGIMNKMRDRMPLIMIILVIAFLGTIVFDWGMNYLGIKGEKVIFAKINGEEITYQEYEQLVQQQIEMMRQQNQGKDVDENTVQQIREQVWNNLLTQTLTKQEMKRLNIDVRDAEILDWIYNRPESLPDVIKKNFMDSAGVFNTAFYQQALQMKTKEATTFWNQVEQYLRDVLLGEKMQAVLTSSVIVPEGEVLQKYKDENIKAKFNYVFLDLNTITDTSVNVVSDEEMKKYYDEHKDEFRQENTVKFKYVIFSDAPTIEDSNSAKKQMEIYINELKDSKLEDSSLIKLVNDISSTPYNDKFQKPNELGKGAVNFLFNAKIDDVSDLIIDQDGYKIIRLIDFKEGEDTYVNASHILFNFGSDTSGAKKKAEDILKRVRAGENINELASQLSEDPSAKQNNGDLGWFTKGAMVKEFEDACMNGKVGDIVGPVKTQYGFHIIKITGRSKKQFKFAEIKKVVNAGGRTKELARKKAEDFYTDVDKGQNFDTLAKMLNVTVSVTGDIAKDGFIPGAGQNKNLISFGLDNKIGKLFNTIKVQGGYGVYQIINKIPEGFKNFDSVKVNAIKPKIVQQKKFELLKQKADDLFSKIQNGDLNSISQFDPNYKVESSDSITMSKPDAKIGQDYGLYNEIFSTVQGQPPEIIKGIKGYYIVSNINVTPFDEQDYISKSATIKKELLTQRQQSAVQEWLANLQNKADIIDNRDRFFN